MVFGLGYSLPPMPFVFVPNGCIDIEILKRCTTLAPNPLSEILHFSGEVLLLNIQIISGAISWFCCGHA